MLFFIQEKIQEMLEILKLFDKENLVKLNNQISQDVISAANKLEDTDLPNTDQKNQWLALLRSQEQKLIALQQDAELLNINEAFDFLKENLEKILNEKIKKLKAYFPNLVNDDFAELSNPISYNQLTRATHKTQLYLKKLQEKYKQINLNL